MATGLTSEICLISVNVPGIFHLLINFINENQRDK